MQELILWVIKYSKNKLNIICCDKNDLLGDATQVKCME